jgi:hypothetical protein
VSEQVGHSFDDISKGIIKGIEEQGFKCNKDTPECVIYLNEHPDTHCEGCPTEMACRKYVRMELTMLLPMMYTPKDFNDFQVMNNRVVELLKMIMEAKTIDELMNIPNC